MDGRKGSAPPEVHSVLTVTISRGTVGSGISFRYVSLLLIDEVRSGFGRFEWGLIVLVGLAR